MQDTLPTTNNDSNGRWILSPTIKRAAYAAIPFPDFHDGRVGMAVYELNQDHVARVVDMEADA